MHGLIKDYTLSHIRDPLAWLQKEYALNRIRDPYIVYIFLYSALLGFLGCPTVVAGLLWQM